MPLRIESTVQSRSRIDVRGVCRAAFAGLSRRDFERTTIHVGATTCALAEMFRVTGSADDRLVEWHGELSRVDYLGYRLESGEVRVESAAGDFLGSQMTGGLVLVRGQAGCFVGQGMRGGQITVFGQVGDYAGGASAVSAYGMAGGKVLVHGRAGANAGYRMRRGLLAVTEGAGDFAARQMLAGTIFLGAGCGRLPGAGMKRGTLLLPGTCLDRLPATFVRACQLRPVAIQLVMGSLRRSGFPCPERLDDCEMYLGDQLEGGRGEVFGWNSAEDRI